MNIDLILALYDIALVGVAAYVVRWALRRHRSALPALKQLEALGREQDALWIAAMYAVLPPTPTQVTPVEAQYPALPEPNRETSS